MGHHHAHSGSCSHHSTPTSFHTAFAIGITLNSFFVAVEFFFGWYAHSLGLMADAAHNLGDVLALLLAWLGYYLAKRPFSEESRFTFGLGRISIYATVFNGLTLVVSSIWILIEACERLTQSQEPMAFIIGCVAFVGIIVNGVTAWLLAKGQDDVNIKGAMLHMVADALVSVGVVISAGLIAWTSWFWIDPAVSIVISVLILWGGWPVLREGLHLALDAVPGHLNRKEVSNFLKTYPDLTDAHTIHIWALSTSKTALSAHIIPREGVETDGLLRHLREALESKFKLTHVTLQIEKDPAHCTDKSC